MLDGLCEPMGRSFEPVSMKKLLLTVPGVTFWAIPMALMTLGACSSQPAKYRKAKDCKCPEWNRMAPIPSNSYHADRRTTASPYYCGPASGS